MSTDNPDYLYIYDEDYHQIILINGETGERIKKEDDKVTSVLKYFQEKSDKARLRKFAVWCSYQMNGNIKPIQKKLIELAERAIEGVATKEQLEELYIETEGAAIATDTVGLRQGAERAPAFLATRECVNPNAFEAAIQTARFHRLWAEMKHQNERKDSAFLREIKASNKSTVIRQIEQQQIDYLLDLIGNKA